MFARRRATNPSFCGTSPRKIGFAMDDGGNGYAVLMSTAVTERAAESGQQQRQFRGVNVDDGFGEVRQRGAAERGRRRFGVYGVSKRGIFLLRRKITGMIRFFFFFCFKVAFMTDQ
ncbi:hypothetical protein U1Q18_012593 [Sarracenia purpurea var. burkii]